MTTPSFPVTALPEFPLWPAAAPGALGSGPQDIPTLTPFLPDPASATGAAIVICPGGGYWGLAEHEGEGYARWLAANGIAGFVLKYRLASAGYHHPVMLGDAVRALRTVRARAGEWGVDPQRIGVMGSSAGGHLASTLLTHYSEGDPLSDDPINRVSSRPSLGILCYAVITFTQQTNGGTRVNLLGTNPDPAWQDWLSNEKQVTQDTPPCFLWHTAEDRVVPVENALLFARALDACRVPFDLHIYQKGHHGLGLGPGPEPLPWAADCLYWLREQGFLK